MAGNSVINARDFILIGEFCQVDGPRAVLTLPSSLGQANNNEQFNLDEFLLYIMTTDYQNFSGDKWLESADVSCIRTNILPNCHAILHYFTLKDPQARGGVRPSCIAYVTQDSSKLYRLRKDLIQAVSISAQIFKHANMRWMANCGKLVETKVDLAINEILDSWSQGDDQATCEMIDGTTSSNSNLEPWVNLCSVGVPIVISGLLKLYKSCCRPLEAHIMDQKKVSFNIDLFHGLNQKPFEDPDFKSLMLQLYSNY